MEHAIIETCKERIRAAMQETIEAEQTICCITVETDDGWIDICTNDRDEKEAIVRHEYDEMKRSPRLEFEVESIIPDWGEVAEQAEQDKPDTILDEAFGSWVDGFHS